MSHISGFFNDDNAPPKAARRPAAFRQQNRAVLAPRPQVIVAPNRDQGVAGR